MDFLCDLVSELFQPGCHTLPLRGPVLSCGGHGAQLLPLPAAAVYLGILDLGRRLGSRHLHAWCALLPIVAGAYLCHVGMWLRLGTGFLVPSPAT